jgi:hypothetical protein
MLGGCAQPGDVFEPIEAPKLGALEAAYDRSKWRWVRNPDGRALLTHTEVRKCFVDPQPTADSYDTGFTVKRSEKTIGAARYEVISVFEKKDFWEALYRRSGSTTPLLSVYAEGSCQAEAERILDAYERGLASGVKGVMRKSDEKK